MAGFAQLLAVCGSAPNQGKSTCHGVVTNNDCLVDNLLSLRPCCLLLSRTSLMMNLLTADRPVRRRNRVVTIERILQATATLFAEKGVDQTGINAIAERADFNKVLIYRYFGGWNGLVEAYVRQGFYLSFIDDRRLATIPAANTPDQRAQHWQSVLVGIAQELHDRPATRALIRWEMANPQTELAHRIAHLRNAAFSSLLTRLVPSGNCGEKASAMVALLWGGLAYLALSSEGQEDLINRPIGQPAGWQQIEQAINCLARSLAVK